MFASMTGWVFIAILICVIIVIGAIILPIFVPLIGGFFTDSDTVISTGSSFLQILVAWWPLILPGIFVLAIVILITLKRGD